MPIPAEALWEHPTASAEPYEVKRRNIITTRDLLSRPEISYLVQGLIPEGSHVGLVGPSGAGKTFGAIALALSVAEGLPWMGRRVNRAGPVLYCTTEGQAGLSKRIRAALLSAGMGGSENVFWDTGRLAMLESGDVGKFVDDVDYLLPTKPALIILDNLARYITPGNENDTRDMGAFVDAVGMIQESIGCAVVTVHHTGHNAERERGSSAFRAALDTMFVAKKDGFDWTLTVEKNKDGASQYDLHATFRTVETGGIDSEGQPITSLAIDRDTAGCPHASKSGPKMDAVLWAILEAMSLPTMSGWVSKSAIADAARLDQSKGKTVQRRLADLYEMGYVTQDGQGNQRRYQLTDIGALAANARKDMGTSRDNVWTVPETGVGTTESPSLEGVPVVPTHSDKHVGNGREAAPSVLI